MSARAAILSILLCAPALAHAAEPEKPACPANPELGGTPFAGWAGADADPSVAIVPERPVTLDTKDGAATQTLRVETAGRYGVAADGRVWIDVAANGATLTSVAHGHGPACSGIRKVVWFNLPAGASTLSLSKTEAARVRILIVRSPAP